MSDTGLVYQLAADPIISGAIVVVVGAVLGAAGYSIKVARCLIKSNKDAIEASRKETEKISKGLEQLTTAFNQLVEQVKGIDRRLSYLEAFAVTIKTLKSIELMMANMGAEKTADALLSAISTIVKMKEEEGGQQTKHNRRCDDTGM